MSYYLAPSLEVLRAEINARWPRRDKASDGWIGDPAHQATKSDHNPNDRGSVNALDVDEDGLNFAEVFAAITRHPSARYVIYERRLYHRLRGWRAEPYSGVNPHDKHFHLSIDQTRTAEQDRRPWGLLEDDVSAADVWATKWEGAKGVLYPAETWLKNANKYAGEAKAEAAAAKAEATRARLTAEATLAAVKGLDTKAVLARINEVAAAEQERDQTAAADRAELAELVRQAAAGELTAEQVLAKLRDLLPTDATQQQG